MIATFLSEMLAENGIIRGGNNTPGSEEISSVKGKGEVNSY